MIALEIEKEKANYIQGEGAGISNRSAPLVFEKESELNISNTAYVVSRQTSGEDTINTSTDCASLTDVKTVSVCSSSSSSSSSSIVQPSFIPPIVESYGLHEMPSSVLPMEQSPWQKTNAKTVTSP